MVNNEKESAFNTFLAWWGTLTLIIFYLPMGAGDVLRLTVIEFLVCLLLGLIPTALAFILYNIGVKYDRNGNVIILGYFEPFVATINKAIFLQQISIFTILGGILIIIANIIILRNSKKTNQNNTIEME